MSVGGARWRDVMGPEMAYLIAALLLVIGLIYGTLSWRNRERVRATERIMPKRHRGETSADGWPVDTAPPDTARLGAAYPSPAKSSAHARLSGGGESSRARASEETGGDRSRSPV